MINIYDAKETNFTNNGLAILNNAIECTITEKANSVYGLELEYPILDKKYEYLKEGNIIKANTPKNGMQLFRISKKRIIEDRVYITANHIFYDLLGHFIEDTRPTKMSGILAIQNILQGTVDKHRFTANSNISRVNSANYIRKNVVESLISDLDQSFLNRWGGELERDNFNIKINDVIGQDRGFTIKYGKNLVGIEENIDMSSIITKIMPTGLNANDTTLMLPEKYIESKYIGNYANISTKEFHYTGLKVDEEKGITKEVVFEKLREQARELFEVQKIDLPKFNYKINFVELSKTEEYKNYSILQQIYLYDIVTNKHKILNLDLKAKVISYKWDAIANKYLEIELGDFKDNISNSFTKIENTLEQISKNLNNVTYSLQTQIDGKIETYFQNEDPMLEWEDSSIHSNDMWYKLDTKELFRFDVDKWVIIEDKKAIEAYEQAERAYYTADGKRTIYVAQPTIPYVIGDLWLTSKLANAGDMYKCINTKKTGDFDIQDWVLATKYTDDSSLDNFINTLYTKDKNDLQKAIDRATDLITNNLGGYVLKRNGELLIMDTEDVNTATKIWRWNLSGLGYATSYNGRYETALTMDGAINANFITTGILNADMVKTGTLKSKDGSVSIDLNNGSFRMGGNGKTATHTADYSSFEHLDGTYTKISANGLERRLATETKTYKYLTYSGEILRKSQTGSVGETNLIIQLPDDFKNKDFSVTFSLGQAWAGNSDTVLKNFDVKNVRINKTDATVTVTFSITFASMKTWNLPDPIVAYTTGVVNYLVIA